MRIPTILRGAFLLLAVASPSLLSAQFKEFKAPTDEELKMTADPKAPGAAAVYLYYEELDNDPEHRQDIYARIKVLTDKGKELATVNLPYLESEYKITDIEGRTIHPDGTVVKLTGNERCLSDERILSVRRGRFVAHGHTMTDTVT